MLKRYLIQDSINAGEKMLSISITDKRGDMFDLVIPYMNPAVIYERGFIKVLKHEALMRKLTVKDAHLITTRKEREFVINTSMIVTENYYSATTIDNIVVVDDITGAFYESLKSAVNEIVGKMNSQEKEE
jgi:ATP-dependent protease HslVU (ClpYQ) ATPase subunit